MNTKEMILLFASPWLLFASLFILGMAIDLRITEGSAGGYAIMCIPAAFYLLLKYVPAINTRDNKRKYYK